MKRFEFIPHTADVQFKAYGKDLEEAFASAVLATTAVMTEDKIQSKETKEIAVEAENKEALLYDFLEEIIFLVDTEAFIVGEVQVRIIKEGEKFKLKATLKGDIADNYEIQTHIKSVTYNDMFIKEEGEKVTIQVVHDI